MSHENPKIERIAITGINSFPGRLLLPWVDHALTQPDHPLAKRFGEVIALDRKPTSTKLSKTRFYKIDLTETAADQKIAELFKQENITCLVHLAFQYNPTKRYGYAHELHSIGTMYLLNACAHQKVKKIIINSSTYCYGAFPNNPNFLSETHPLRGGEHAPFIRDRIDVEKQAERYQKKHTDSTVTILRPCAILGPNIDNFASMYLSRKICLTCLGFDPLVQLVHEKDVLKAFQIALEKDVKGAFNIVGDGVLPLLTVLRMGGKFVLPLSSTMLLPMVQALWQMDFAVVPPTYLNYIRYLWVADGQAARDQMKFTPQYSTRDTVLSFFREQRLKDVHLEN